MKKAIILISLLLAMGMGISLFTHAFTKEPPDNKKIILENLKKIEDLYIKKLNFEERRAAIKLLDNTIDLILNDKGNGSSNQPTPPQVLSEESFRRLFIMVSDTIDEDYKITLIQSIGKEGYILSSQLAELLKTFSFDSYKVKCIKLIYPNVYDKANIGIAIETIDSGLSRKEVIEYINK